MSENSSTYKPLAGTFFFDSFEIERDSGKVLFHYSTDGSHLFTHELAFENLKGDLDAAIFALGMAELVGYWKAILAPKIVIRAGQLSDEQITFWENLYRNGLGEFFYKNQIDFRNLINIEVDDGAPEIKPIETERSGKVLVPFGGGKDSLVSGEVLKELGKDFSWFELEPLSFSKKLMEVSENTNTVSVGRDVQKNFAPVLGLVKEGAPNGHVPITSVYIFSAVVAGMSNGFSDIALSLERSAEEGNLEYLGMNVNHQYSKTFEFEKEVSEYVKKYINPNIRVFSLLRPFYEIQITKKFSGFEKYFPYFISCNKGLKTGTWCGECAKCAFMFAGLSAFLSPQTVESIWKKNLFEDENLLPLYKDMIGLGSSKPFDCVGTYHENILLLFLSGEQYKKVGMDLPVILKELPIEEGEQYRNLLDEKGDDHIIPEEYTYDFR